MKFPMDCPVKVVMLGAGGTGGYVAPYLFRLLHMLDRPARFIICDGDLVEAKNLDRQNFVEADLGENKARVLSERYSAVLGMETEYVPNFIETLPELMPLIEPGEWETDDYYPIAQAKAWLSGHDKVESSDLLALKDYLWRLPADREKVESVLNRFCINPMQEKVNDVREMALDSQAGFEEACGDGSREDLARKAFIKLRGELVRLYQKQCELRTSAQSDSETALMDGLLNDLEDISRRAHEKTGFTYTPLSEIAALN